MEEMDTSQWQAMVTNIARESRYIIAAGILDLIDDGVNDPSVIIMDLRDPFAQKLALVLESLTMEDIRLYCKDCIGRGELPTHIYGISAEQARMMFESTMPRIAARIPKVQSPGVFPTIIFTEGTGSVCNVLASELGLNEGMTEKERRRLRKQLNRRVFKRGPYDTAIPSRPWWKFWQRNV